jgi:hypothetical protein
MVSAVQDVDRQGHQRSPEPVREGAGKVRRFPSPARVARSKRICWLGRKGRQVEL